MKFEAGQMVRVCDPASPYARSDGKVVSTDPNSGKVRVELRHFRCPTEWISFPPRLLQLAVNQTGDK
jgi:transcription antitermination factor NusG